MAHHLGSNNVNLVEAPLPAASYNALPHIDSMKSAAAEHSDARKALLDIIAAHNLQRHFSIHLIHKHFDVPDGRIMVYESITGPNHPRFLLCSPKEPERCETLRGLYFQARSNRKMTAYEFTTDQGEDLSAHEGFVAEFSNAVLDLGVQNVFALTAKAPETKRLTEFEMPDLRSTILVSDPSWLPPSEVPPTSTDWISSSVPGAGPIGLTDCTQTQSGGHYNFTCSQTRSGQHYQQKSVWVENGNGEKKEQIFLDDVAVPQDSEAFAIISHAISWIAA